MSGRYVSTTTTVIREINRPIIRASPANPTCPTNGRSTCHSVLEPSSTLTACYASLPGSRAIVLRDWCLWYLVAGI